MSWRRWSLVGWLSCTRVHCGQTVHPRPIGIGNPTPGIQWYNTFDPLMGWPLTGEWEWGAFCQITLTSCSTILHNSSITFNRCWSNCYNELVLHFGAILKWIGLGCLVLAFTVRASVQWTMVCAVHAGIGQFKFVCYWVVFLYINVVDFNSFFLYYPSVVEVFFCLTLMCIYSVIV